MTIETAKPVPGFSNYSVDELGNVYNTVRNVQLRLHDANGYLQARLINDAGKRINTGAHRVVAMTWVGPIPTGYWVNHKNGNRSDNRAENLEITTPQANHIHARDVLQRKYISSTQCKSRKLAPESIDAIKALRTLGWTHRQIGKAMQVSGTCIGLILRGESWVPGCCRGKKKPVNKFATPE